MDNDEKPDLDPVDLARLNQKPKKQRNGWSQDQQAVYFAVKIGIFILIAIIFSTCVTSLFN